MPVDAPTITILLYKSCDHMKRNYLVCTPEVDAGLIETLFNKMLQIVWWTCLYWFPFLYSCLQSLVGNAY